MPAMEKRERFLAIWKLKSSYLEYKKVKSSDQPDTPRPADFTSKRSWESAVFLWRTAIREATEAPLKDLEGSQKFDISPFQ